MVVLVLATATGCAQFTIQTHPDPDVDFARYGTFGWLPLAAAAPIDQDMGSRGLTDRTYAAVETELERKGWKPAANDTADLLVTFRLLRGDGYDDSRIPYMSAWQRGTYRAALHEASSSYTRGTLIIDVLQRTGPTLVWRGAASARLLSQPSYERMVERAEAAIEQILASFPVRAR
jgi:hypothetical protein